MSFITVLLIYLVGVVLAYFIIGIGNYLEKYNKSPTGIMFLSWLVVIWDGVYLISNYFPKPEDIIIRIIKLFKK